MAYSFTKNWTNPVDFPTVETNEAKVREDMQYLFNELLGFVNNLASGAGFSSGSISYSKLTGVQKKVRHVVLTVTADKWMKHSITVDGSTKYYHEAKFLLGSSGLGSLTDPLASSIIIQPRPRRQVDTPGNPSYTELVQRFAHTSGVQFGIAGYEANGSLLNPGYDFSLVAYGWGNAAGKDVVLDIFVLSDTDDSTATAHEQGAVPNS